ncbi:hypothetical protein [Pseudonocardia dioxanivorans]|uniref:hypothetical protein n=1 Tax=Pseudonocardia dioxanivorans TaxID=240495 RepID=UPI0018F89BC2|nr:hypothetical protein [Pseudonocardia dioxanivorans]
MRTISPGHRRTAAPHRARTTLPLTALAAAALVTAGLMPAAATDVARASCSAPVVSAGTAAVPCAEDGGGVSAGAGTATAPGVAACPGGAQVTRPYFQKADWLWDPIPADPKLDPQSAKMAGALAGGDHILNTGEFGVTLVDPEDIPADAPRSAVPLSEKAWGPDPLAGITVPVPPDLPIPPGSDGHVAIADASTNTVVNLWVTKKSGNGLKASWGAATPLDGDGRETNGSSTGAGIARYAAVVRAQEIADHDIPHALFFSTNIVKPKEVRYPATKTDGSNMDGSSAPIPEGARVQLDPSVDVDAIPGIGKGEAAIAKALQTYGAYVGDNGGARMAFIAEYAPGSTAYEDAGLSGDFVGLKDIPWDKLRVLSDWSGGTRPTPGTDPADASDEDTGGPEAVADPPATTQPPHAAPGGVATMGGTAAAAPAENDGPAAGACVPGSGSGVAPPTTAPPATPPPTTVPPTAPPTTVPPTAPPGTTGGGTASAPADSAPAGSAPAGSAPAGSAPTGSAPTGSAPTGSAPTGSAPTGSAPVGSAPVGSAPVGSAPAGSPPAGSASAGSAPAGSAPAGSTPVGSGLAVSDPAAAGPVGSGPAGSTAPAGSGAPVG